ncbi:MAG: hypothetical protein ACRD88_22945, partial [Terriglobia bacterium]
SSSGSAASRSSLRPSLRAPRKRPPTALDGEPAFPASPIRRSKELKKVMEIYDYHEMRKHKPEDFYDDSFIRELDQSGYIASLYR